MHLISRKIMDLAERSADALGLPRPPATIPGPADLGDAPTRTTKGRRWWMVIACSMLIAGLVASFGSALLWRSSVKAHDRQQFQTSSTDVNEAVETLLRRDADFVTTLRGVLTMQPHLSATRFDQWFSQLQGRQREMSGLGTTVVEVVPAAELAAFQARRAANPAFRAFVGGSVVPVVPSSTFPPVGFGFLRAVRTLRLYTPFM